MRLRLIRTGYRIAWRVLWLLGPLYGGRGLGVKAILINDDRVLLVQHTYGPSTWELPGGGVHRSESPLDAVRRELREELGVEIAEPRLVAFGSGAHPKSRRSVSIFAAEVAASAVSPDQREIARAEWFASDALPPGLGRQVAAAVAVCAGAQAELPVTLGGTRRVVAPRPGPRA